MFCITVADLYSKNFGRALHLLVQFSEIFGQKIVHHLWNWRPSGKSWIRPYIGGKHHVEGDFSRTRKIFQTKSSRVMNYAQKGNRDVCFCQ